MNKHLKLFANHSAYSQAESNLDKPNVVVCQQEEDVHFNPDPFNGHAYVDLGLPSGTLWAKMNVGANSETDYGLYFAWGETQGYADASTKAFTWSDYKFNPSGDSSTFTKYNDTDNLTHLDLEDDAANVNMGGDWHMPNRAQCEELFNREYVTSAWVENYNGSGVNGRLFTSVSNGNTLFVPAASYCGNGKVEVVGNTCNVWASALKSVVVSNAKYLYFDSDGEAFVDEDLRYVGQSIRGVVGEAPELKSHTWYEDHLEIVLSKPATNVTLIYQRLQGHDPEPKELTLTSSDGITWITSELAGDRHCANITVIANGITVGSWSETSYCRS